jgi:hypothetical protein
VLSVETYSLKGGDLRIAEVELPTPLTAHER